METQTSKRREPRGRSDRGGQTERNDPVLPGRGGKLEESSSSPWAGFPRNLMNTPFVFHTGSKARAPRPMLAANSPVTSRCDSAAVESDLLSELLILPDGRVLVHNLTPAFADLLHELNPDDGQIRPRARRITRHAPRTTPHTP